jgi:2-dehydro-3-deoxyglucarate aldolase
VSTARFDRITALRAKLRAGQPSVGSWLQIPSPDVAELVASGGFDWVAIDTEHGAVSRHQLPDLMRAIELQGALPLVRVSHPDPRPCQQALDAGAGGVVVPRIEDAATLREIVAGCQWPPAGRRGVGFSRANLFGKHFEAYKEEAEQPLIVAQVESKNAVDNIESLIAVEGVDAVMIGPYDLSASLGLTGEIGHARVQDAVASVVRACQKSGMASGIHVVQPDAKLLASAIDAGHRFIAFGVDAVFISSVAVNPRRNA